MRLKLYWLILFVLTVLLPVRRLLWNQAATQVAPHWVWITIALNAGILLWLITKFYRDQIAARTQPE